MSKSQIETNQRKIRIVKALDTEDGWSMLLNTNLTEAEIEQAITSEKWEDDNLDYQMKCARYAKENGLFCEEIDPEVVRF